MRINQNNLINRTVASSDTDQERSESMVGVILQVPRRLQSKTKSRKLPRLAGRFGSSAHEQRVAQIALRLFDLLALEHGLGSKYRNILRLGAFLHDAGRSFGAADHHLSGAKMVLEDQRLVISARTRRCVAYLVRYHRGKVPWRDTEILLGRDRQRKLRILLGLLRAADGLDSRCAPATAIVAKCKCQRLRIHCLVQPSASGAHERLGAAKKFQLLERTLKLDVDVRVETILPEGAAAAA